jgi:glycosyltransferase involved in cell wall biosynthesis
VKKKNYDLLLEVAERMPAVRFAVLGSGPEGGRLRNATLARGIANIDWRGPAQASEVRNALAAASVFLNLSYEEGSPTAAMEAMAVGIPAVLTPSNDYSALLGDGAAGIVLDGWDPDVVAATLSKLLHDSERRAVMSLRARERAACERWHVKAQQVTDAMEQALDRTGS